MAKPWDITGDEIAQWSQQFDAPSVLPELVRRLLLATSPISSITMSAHAGTRLPDWDGVVRTSAQTAFCPAGTSIWELTVDDDTSKLNHDFKKRNSDKGSFDPLQTTYVAVSARRVRGKVRWEAAKHLEQGWKDVRLLDADDLATWLAGAPAVARWLANRLHRPVGEMEDLDGFLENWRRRTQPPLPLTIAVAGQERQRLAEGVRAFARSARKDAVPLRIHGDTWEEATVFAAAALALDPTPEGEQVRARTVIVRSEEALLWALRDQDGQALVPIAAFERPSASRGPAILPMQGPAPAESFHLLRLLPMPYRRFAEILVEAGMRNEEAVRVAEKSGGKLASLQRLLGHVELPRWAEGIASVPLSAMLLVGAYEPDNQEDRDVLSLLGADPREVELVCERLRIVPDAPMHKEQSRSYRPVWSWRAPEDAWRALAGQIPAEALRHFGEVIDLVLGERDPKLDLPPEQRFAAAVHGKVLRASESLRQGLVRSLVRLSLHDDALAPLHGPKRGSGLAIRAVRALLPPPWEPWASLSGLLPLLAEAAPDIFLECVETSLREGDAGVAHLLAEEAFMGGSPHTGLLWALETLGWDERLMPRVASALAKLAEYDAKLEQRPGRLANRPDRSLKGLLRLAFPQTCATADSRISEMKRRLRETPEVGFRLLVEEMASLGGMPTLLDPSHPPQLRLIKIPSPEEQQQRYRTETVHVINAYLDMAFDHMGHDADRWAYFLEQVRMVPRLAVRVLDRLEAVQGQIRDEHAKLWGAIRHVLRWSSISDETESADQEKEGPDRKAIFGRWKRLYHEVFEPQDLALRYAWLFLSGAELPEPYDPEKDPEDEECKLDEFRMEAVENIGSQQEERLKLLDALAERTKETSALGSTLGRSTFARELDDYLLSPARPPSLKSQVPSFLRTRWSTEGREWVEQKLRAMLNQGRRDEVETTLLAFFTGSAIWDLVDALGEDIRRSYWRRFDRQFGSLSADETERAMKNLLEAGNIAGALKVAGRTRESVRPELVAEALHAFLDDPGEGQRFARDSMASHYLERLLSRLEAAPDADSKYADLLAKVELVYAVGTHKPKRPLRRLSAAFASNPGQFISLVKSRYHRHGEPQPTLSETEQQATIQTAQAAYRVLEAWKGYPGEGFDAERREAVLYDWSLHVLRELVAEGRPHTGASEVARVLARAPEAEDGFWPCLAARRLLELDEIPALANALMIAKQNRLGMTGRSLGEGGKQERELAAGYRKASDKLRLDWPRTADMLDGLADSYENDAAREDAEAETTLRQEGAEPADFGEPPHRPAPSPKRRIHKPGIVQIERIELTDFTRFERIQIPLQPPPERGQWLILLAENGWGKTTLLRALALALAGTNVAQAALGQLQAPLIRFGQSSARCEVLCGGESFTTAIVDDGTGDAASCEPLNGARPQVFGYGCRRGSALSGSDATDITSPFSDVATLFDESARLYPAPSWLKDLKLRALQDQKYAHIFGTVTKKLCELLPEVERLDVVGNQVFAIAPKLGGRVPLAALSDGYLTTLGWLVDLVARWLHWAEQMKVDLEGDFFARMEGVVLVDEIDLHLHPRWQRTIVASLKETFPRLSFVVTTHNLLTLLGAEAGEIVVLREAADQSGRAEAKRFDLPPGIRADRILTGEWFGLPYTVDDDTIKLIEKHQQMLLSGVPQDAPERSALEEELAVRYGSYADTSIDRMALEVAAELMRERQPKTPEQRKDLRERLKKRVKERLAKQERQGGAKD